MLFPLNYIIIYLFYRNIDNFIGRAAHIQFLESQALTRMLVYSFDNFFK